MLYRFYVPSEHSAQEIHCSEISSILAGILNRGGSYYVEKN